MRSWYKSVNLELNNLINNISPFPYGNFIGYFIHLTGILCIIMSMLLFEVEKTVTYFSKFGILFVGFLLTSIGKVLLAIMRKRTKQSLLPRIFSTGSDAFLFSSILSIILYSALWYGLKLDKFDIILYVILLFIISFLAGYIIIFFASKQPGNYKFLSAFVAITFIPYRLLFFFIKKKYHLFLTVVSVASTLLLSMILLAFQVGGVIDVLNPFKSFNSNYLVLLIFMLLSHKLVSYLIPKTSLGAYFNDSDDRLVKIFMTWGMIIAMAAFYMFDWKLLMGGLEAWSDMDKNNVLWSFTTYRLIASMLEKKFNLFDS